MKFLIDHTKLAIHISSFVGDACDFHTTLVKHREGSRNQTYVASFVEKSGYHRCKHCFPGIYAYERLE